MSVRWNILTLLVMRGMHDRALVLNLSYSRAEVCK
jgi:hypothetical protein